jgi:hypothetical protein
MKKIVVLLSLFFISVNLYGAKNTLVIRDKDTGKALSKVSVILFVEGKRKKLGKTDEQGRYDLENQRKYKNNKIMLWKKDYKKSYFTLGELMKKKDTIYLKEKKAPENVTDISIEQSADKTTLKWKHSTSEDTDYYTIYYREGLNPYKKWKDKVREDFVDIMHLETDRDYSFRIKAIDKNKNKNKGVEFTYYQTTPQKTFQDFGSVTGQLNGLFEKAGIVKLYPLNLGDTLNVDASPLVIKCEQDGSFSIEKVPAGTYTIKAWADVNTNGTWNGNWLGHSAEPRVSIKRQVVEKGAILSLDLTLQSQFTGVPTIIYDEQPGYVDLYNAAWDMARAKITAGKTENGFVTAYMDEGFNNHIYQWDTCFMMFFGIYGGDDFPAMNSLDNFYVKQRSNGYICRVQNEDTGGDYDPSLSDPSVNPPLYAWIEWNYFRVTGDDSRLLWALTHLDKYYQWLKNNTRRKEGYYFTSNLGSGMDNSPREGLAYGWIDMTAQMALFAHYMQNMAEMVDMPVVSSNYQQEYTDLSELINRNMWDEEQQIYFDVKKKGALHKKKTIASFWPLLAGIVPDTRANELVSHLENPNEFKTAHVFPTLSKDESEYDKKGYYWRGGVWAPTTFMAIKGLEYNGYLNLAYRSSLNHIDNMWKVFAEFVPDKKRLPYKEGNIPFPAHLDGTKQIWELYSPEMQEPGTRWDNNFYCRPEFVGWSGVGPIVLMIENVLGIIPDTISGSISWDIRSDKRHGVQGLLFDGRSVDLIMTGLKDGVPQIEVKSDAVFTLFYTYKGSKYVLEVNR